MNSHQHLRTLWDNLRTSLWFQPVLGAIFGTALAALFSELDRHRGFANLPLFRISVEGSQAVLGAIATGMLTVLGLVFSILMVALVLASQQFSPRILRNFIRDQAAQNVIAVFVGVFVYSLILLARINHTAGGIESPVLSVTIAIVLTLAALGVFIYFIDHITKTIRANYIMADINRHVMQMLRNLPRAGLAEPLDTAAEDVLQSEQAKVIPAPTVGYLQSVDREMIVQFARQYDVVVRVEPMIGDFVAAGSPLFTVGSTAEEINRAKLASLTSDLLETIMIGIERTLLDDPLFGIRQLVDIALKAVSPAVNDPTTAVNCIDYLSNELSQATRQGESASTFQDHEGTVRLLMQPPTFAAMLDLAFNQLRRYTATDAVLTERLLDALIEIAQATQTAQRHALLWRHAGMISRSVEPHIREPFERQAINERLRTLAALAGQQPDSVLLAVDEAWLAAHTIKIDSTGE